MVLVAASLALDDILVAEDGFQRPEENLFINKINPKEVMDGTKR